MSKMLTNPLVLARSDITLLSYLVLNIEVVPSTKAILQVVFIDENGEKYGRRIILEGEEYLKWGSDDTYLETVINEYAGTSMFL